MSARLPAAERREQLLDVALKIFSANGFHGSSMNEVAEAAGVTKPVLYQHFASKKELYSALIDRAGDWLLQPTIAGTEHATGPHDQVALGIRSYFRWVSENPESFVLLFGDNGHPDGEFTQQIRKLEKRMAETVAPLIRAEIDREHQKVLAYGIVGLAESTARRLVAQDVIYDPDTVATQIADMLWGGLRAVHR
jgi:AcrR family transcriptional regulator